MKPIIINDSVMGSGKTSHAIERMNAEPDRLWMFSTPLLDEIDRIKNACPVLNMKDPQTIDGRKTIGFNYLISNESNIAVTHACLTRSTQETFQLLEQSRYNLIIDEVMDCLVPLNDLPDCKLKLNKTDIQMLSREGFIKTDEYGQVTWLKPYHDGLFSDLEEMADAGNLYCIGKDSMFFWRFPPKIWEHFESVEILTYLFDSSQLKLYFDYYEIPYEKVTTVRDETGNYSLAPYSISNEKAQRSAFKNLITIHGESLKVEGSNANGFLNKSWYESNRKAKKAKNLEALKKSMVNFINNKMKVKAQDVMWTVYNDYEGTLTGKGYSRFKRSPEEIAKALESDADEKIEKYSSCFVPCNARASNQYGNRHTLMYMVNLFTNRKLYHFFEMKNKLHGTDEGYKPIVINENAFSLSCFLQWCWRSAIRNGEPIDVFIPSKRIRNLFIDWLNGDDSAITA